MEGLNYFLKLTPEYVDLLRRYVEEEVVINVVVFGLGGTVIVPFSEAGYVKDCFDIFPKKYKCFL